MNYLISIIYVYYNTPNEIVNSVRSIKNSIGDLSYEIIIVDNASIRKIPQSLKKDKKIKIIENIKNYGYGKAVNIAGNQASGKYFLIVNSDIKFTKNAINTMVKKMEKDQTIGILGPQVLNINKKITQSFGGMPFLPGALFVFSFLNRSWSKNPFSKKYWLYNLDKNKEQKVDYVGGVCMLIKKTLFKKIKGFDDRFFMYFEEADICYRIKKIGYKVLYFPKAKIIHLIAKSSQDRNWIKRVFEQSRFKFFNKYHGFFNAFFAELFLRYVNLTNILLFFILALSLFLNLYKIDPLMMFNGDFGRDYLAARDMLLTRKIPLVGITSSVVWLHQGPLSIYLIGIAFLLSNFNPVAPAMMYGVIGVCSTFFVYKLGKIFFNKNVGLLAGAFFATSPLVIVNIRMPYHTSSIPFFACIFFLLLFKVIKGHKLFLPFLFFLLGLLIQLELSNAVLFFLLISLFFIYKPILSRSDLIKSILGFIFGFLPFIIYDLTHHFVQTLGFPIWIVNRIRLFFGLTLSGNSTTVYVQGALLTIWEQIARLIFPKSQIIVISISLLMILIIWSKKDLLKNNNLESLGLRLLLLWIIIPMIGFLIHASPGTAYFPLIFPAICLLIGFIFEILIMKSKIFLFVFLSLIFINSYFVLKNEYFLINKNHLNTMPPGNYSFGHNLSLLREVSDFIVKDARGREFQIKGGGFFAKFQTGVDNFIYLTWWAKGKINNNAKTSYIIFESKEKITNNGKVVFKNNWFKIVKNE